jgi:hypothetical protein
VTPRNSRTMAIGLAVLLAGPLVYQAASGAQRPAAAAVQAPSSAATAKGVAAANAFLATLDARQRDKARLELRPEVRRRWSNLPSGIAMQVDQGRVLERNGVKLGELTPAQQDAALALLAATLSPAGYQKVIDIVNADEQLERTAGPGRAATSAVKFGRAEYYVAILGTPSASDQWMIQFGGHHLAINITLAGANHALTPSHTGAQPASFTLDGRTVRPLGAELDKAFALFDLLTPAQQKEATLNYKVADVVGGPGLDGKVIQPEGIRASTLTPQQQSLLLDLVSEWVNIVNADAAAARMADIKANLPGTYFAWSGPATRQGGAYFRIQGPTLLVEYAPQASRGSDGLPDHIHTFYRDPTNDYGAKFAR